MIRLDARKNAEVLRSLDRLEERLKVAEYKAEDEPDAVSYQEAIRHARRYLSLAEKWGRIALGVDPLPEEEDEEDGDGEDGDGEDTGLPGPGSKGTEGPDGTTPVDPADKDPADKDPADQDDEVGDEVDWLDEVEVTGEEEAPVTPEPTPKAQTKAKRAASKKKGKA